jgi:cold-inducible RNA-binding protein
MIEPPAAHWKARSFMPYRIYVGNLSYQSSEQELEELFRGAGSKVESAKIISDFSTGRSRGFAFVEVSSREELEKEINRLNGFLFKGRNLVVSEAKARENKGREFSKGSGKAQGYGGFDRR